MAGNATLNKELPLAGVVLCFTSILPEQRSELAAVASQMGATHKFDLTSDVTHLLVGETNTPKYKYVARERSDVVVLMPEWIEAVRQSWMQGGDTDLQALEKQYKLPTFAGLSICITGFEDLSFRNYIQETAIANGAEFSKDLTKNVTHLIARDANGQKYKFATQWNLKVVSVKWFNDSLERGMILDEALYHPLTPHEQQGVGAWNRSLPQAPEKRADPAQSSNPRPRKLRKVASVKLGSQNEGIWSDIMGKGFDTTDQLESESNQQKSDAAPPAKTRPVLQEAKSFASETTIAERQESHTRSQSVTENSASHDEGFLHGCYFFIHGFSSKQVSVLQHHLQFNGATVVGSLSEFSSLNIPKTGHGLYIIVPFKLPRSEIPSTEDMAFECEVVTDMWLERCLDAKSLVPPESHVTSTPFPRFPIPEFRGLRICSTGFARIDLLHLSKLVNIMGATYDEYLTPNASLLICNDPRTANHEKLRHTHEWGIPAVSADWLWISVQTGQKKPFDPYLVRRSPSQQSVNKAAKEHTDKPDLRKQKQRQPQSQNVQEPTKAVPTSPVRAAAEPAKDQAKPANSHSKTQNGIPEEPSTSVQSDGPLKETPTNSPAKPPASPPRPPSPNKASAPDPSPSRPESNHSGSSMSKAFDLAISGLLKQARANSSHPSTNTGGETSDQQQQQQQPRSKRRRPLLGRAGSGTHSSSSTRAGADAPGLFSRASSIDTLNDDGCGSGVESGVENSTEGGSRKTTNGAKGLNSIISGGKFDFPLDRPLYENARREEEEDEAPPMTQLNYEDPDAVAMREAFMRRAGKEVEKKTPNKQGVGDVGAIRELEDIGWGTGRRTRRAGKITEKDDEYF
ncbi:hypothetical protein VTN00DRAFT_4110 [Thermoascus crustaceus]|uniref:uncharacterized protein n=1 Tax=Thermoascus crustaceus TaxID=5088 RepID=UPI0037446B63